LIEQSISLGMGGL